MSSADKKILPTRELPIPQLPQCRCGKQQSGNWTGSSEMRWMMLKPEGEQQTEAGLVEYVCLSCNRHFRLRGNRFLEVLPDGAERPYMRLGQYNRWFSCH